MNHATYRHRAHKLLPLAALLSLFSLPALATNGYFAHGYGLKAKGMGGVSLALSEDAMGGANNPAGMVFAGSRVDFGVDDFMPRRDAERSGASGPAAGLNGKVESDHTAFLIPEFGINRMLDAKSSLGVSVYGNGGMNTTYPQGNFQCPDSFTAPTTAVPGNALCGGGTLGVDLSQLIISPTYARHLDEQHAVGMSLLLGYQRFKAEGLQAFAAIPGFSAAPGRVTNQGYDSATGAGLRLGWQGRFSPLLSVGAAYATRMKMGKFEKYQGLFAEQGGFDIPSNVGLGLSYSPLPALTLAADYTRINYSEVASIGNPSSAQAQLGADKGPGFGWQDVKVVKIGVQWRSSDTLTLRAGYNKGSNPIRPADVSFNILAPGVTTTHYTLGATWRVAGGELTGAYMKAPRQTVTGASLFNGFNIPAGSETIGMGQSSFGLAWGWSY
ncbi:MAG: hypothetical protein RIQ60_3437 [Pseudomonadota bacterium]|jgi:long-chain fatty acid transport protein